MEEIGLRHRNVCVGDCERCEAQRSGIRQDLMGFDVNGAGMRFGR